MKLLQIVVASILAFSSLNATAQEISAEAGASGGVSDGTLIGYRFFYYSDTSSMGGNSLSEGSAVLNRFDVQHNMQKWFSGFGLFYENDTYGKDQTDTVMGVVVEFVLGSFFIKIMPGSMEQTFTNRSFSKRTGSYMAYEGGIRGDLYGGLLFFEIAFQQRSYTLTKQDNRQMADKLSKSATLPVLGVGMSI